MTLESEIEIPCCRMAEEHGWLRRKLQWVGRRDAPDDLFARDGEIVLVEFKAPGEKPRETQIREHKRFAAVGVKVHVIDNVRAFKRLMGIP